MIAAARADVKQITLAQLVGVAIVVGVLLLAALARDASVSSPIGIGPTTQAPLAPAVISNNSSQLPPPGPAPRPPAKPPSPVA